jgi:hypothetical protein
MKRYGVFRTTVYIIAFYFINSFAATDPNFHLYLLFGQSNMAGGCKVGINAEDCDTTARVKVLAWGDCNTQSTACTQYKIVRTYDKWYTAFPPYHNCSEAVGPADYFGKTLLDSIQDNIKIGFIPCALSGQAIAVFEKGSNAAISDYTQPVNGATKITTDGYGWMVRRCKIAQQTGVIKGILFHQGESNAGEGDAWVTKVVTIVKNLKTDLGLSDSIPFIAGELRYQSEGGCCYQLNTYVNKLPSKITNCKVASADGLKKRINADGSTDVYHFDLPSMREFGRRYARAFLSVANHTYVPRKGDVAVLPSIAARPEKAVSVATVRSWTDASIFSLSGKVITMINAPKTLNGLRGMKRGNVYLVARKSYGSARLMVVP